MFALLEGRTAWTRERFQRAVRDPAWATDVMLATARARVRLRGCTRVGPRARLRGTCRVVNRGAIVIGRSFVMTAETVPSELITFHGGRIEIADHVYVNFGCSISARRLVSIGERCLIGPYTLIMDSDDHDPEDHTLPGGYEPVVIEEGVWLGARVTILKGVTIGAGSTVAAGSVVTRDVPPRVVVAGVPARVIRRLGADGSPPR
jgi:maltose O-acetyltransferase